MDMVHNVQANLQTIYGVNITADARDYLIGRDQLLSLMPAGQRMVIPRELFLVNPRPADDTLEIALYLDAGLQTNLDRHNPADGLSGENLADLCTLIEGVSHFVYYLHKATLEHEVTELELELQAEIDKFVLLGFFAGAHGSEQQNLMALLFEGYTLVDALNFEQRERYETATQLARKYCYGLLKMFRGDDKQGLIAAIRAFYSLRQEQKIRAIRDFSSTSSA